MRTAYPFEEGKKTQVSMHKEKEKNKKRDLHISKNSQMAPWKPPPTLSTHTPTHTPPPNRNSGEEGDSGGAYTSINSQADEWGGAVSGEGGREEGGGGGGL